MIKLTLFLFGFLLLSILTGNAQYEKVVNIKMFINELVANVPADSLKKYVINFDYKKKKKKEANRLFKFLIEVERKNLDTFLLDNNNISKFDVVPYLKLDKNQRVLFCPDSPDGYDNIYGIVIGNMILSYYFLKNDKIASFVHISKGHYANGKSDCSYFITM